MQADGTKKWYKNGLLHRENDLPAIEWVSGTKEWYQNGLLHRENNEHAIRWSNGDKEWLNNLRHRSRGLEDDFSDLGNDSSDIVEADDKEYYTTNIIHLRSKPAIEEADGTNKWYMNGLLHRIDGPAIERIEVTEEWYINGKLQLKNKNLNNLV